MSLITLIFLEIVNLDVVLDDAAAVGPVRRSLIARRMDELADEIARVEGRGSFE